MKLQDIVTIQIRKIKFGKPTAKQTTSPNHKILKKLKTHKMTKITIELLEQDGWKQTNDPITPIKKKIENLNPLNDDDEDTGMELIIHHMYNSKQFAILFASGAMLNFSPHSMEELHQFEKMIAWYDAEF